MKNTFYLVVVLLTIMGVNISNANTCLTGTEQVELFKTSLSNSDLPVVGETLFFDDFGESDLNNGNKGRTASPFMPSNGFEFGNSYLQLPTPGGNPWDDNPIRNAARINDGFYAVVAPAYISDGWFSDDGWVNWWTGAWNSPNPIYDYSGTENGAALVINAGENLTPFYEREALIQGGATYRASFKLFVVQGTVQVGIDIIDPVTQNVLYTMQTIQYVNDYNHNNINEWQDVIIDFTMPGICSVKEVVVSFRNHFALVNGNDYYVDNISLEKIADAPACPPVEDCVSNGKTSVNLNDAYVGVIPDSVSLVWYSTSDRSRGLVTNPEEVTTSGTYYAFFYDADNNCYNTDVSTSSVEVFIVPPCNILPIKLVSFDATKKGQVAVLDWITAAEENNSGFDIERSVDGKNWNKIGFTVTQAENGNSSATLNYQFVDEQPMSGTNFYRLKQVDFDGSFDYSMVRQLVFDHFNNAVLVYPNPAQDYVIVDGLNSKATVHVINTTGQEVLKQISESNTMKLQINQLPSGMYYIHVLQDGVEVQVEKVMITK